ncbi:MAG: monovalent cation/H(+) antiporter subunit G [Methanosarcinaceae archaeon]|nr:monovalent cation/H(+) antiporter subunit G [Methanosarcinaceae archaeon]
MILDIIMYAVLGLSIILIIGGMVFAIIGAVGLIRLTDVYLRIHAGSKCLTIGTVGSMVGLFFYDLFANYQLYGMPSIGLDGIKALSIAAFLLITAPTAAHAMAKAAYHQKDHAKLMMDDYKDWEGNK